MTEKNKTLFPDGADLFPLYCSLCGKMIGASFEPLPRTPPVTCELCTLSICDLNNELWLSRGPRPQDLFRVQAKGGNNELNYRSSFLSAMTKHFRKLY